MVLPEVETKPHGTVLDGCLGKYCSLALAIVMRRSDVAGMLLFSGTKGAEYDTVLHCTDVLLRHNADGTARDATGMCPYDRALRARAYSTLLLREIEARFAAARAHDPQCGPRA